MKIYTRWMISRDLPQVLEIDSNSYENWYTELGKHTQSVRDSLEPS